MLTKQEKLELYQLLKDYLNNIDVQSMDHYIQHGSVTTLQHCRNVVRVSFWMNRRFHLGSDEQSLVIGALLHDFYLYDWHHYDGHLHGFYHPRKAYNNANNHFELNEKEKNIILSHMWPLTLTVLPDCRESVIVCIADKYCSLIETFMQRDESKPIG